MKAPVEERKDNLYIRCPRCGRLINAPPRGYDTFCVMCGTTFEVEWPKTKGCASRG